MPHIITYTPPISHIMLLNMASDSLRLPIDFRTINSKMRIMLTFINRNAKHNLEWSFLNFRNSKQRREIQVMRLSRIGYNLNNNKASQQILNAKNELK